MIVLVARTQRPVLRSRPAPALALASLAVAAAAIALPFTPLATPLGFTPIPARFLAILGGVLAAYILAAEALKRRFWAPRP